MEALAEFLEPYGNSISRAISIAAFLDHLSGAIICKRICRRKTPAGISIVPFLAGVVISMMKFRFASILNSHSEMPLNFFGAAQNVGYIYCFFCYANNFNDKKVIRYQIKGIAAFLATVFVYTLIEDPNDLPPRYGIIFNTVLIVFLCLMVINIVLAIQRKSTEGMSFPIIVSRSILSFLSLLYAIVTREKMTVIQKSIFTFITIAQLSLFAVFPSKSIKPESGFGSIKKE